MKKPKPCITLWWNTPDIWEHSRNVENTAAPTAVIGDIGDLLSERHALEKSKNRKILLSILSKIRYLARQALPLRGDLNTETMSEEKSNFHQLLKLRAQENPEIIEWLRKRDEKYSSLDLEIQNDLLEAMALNPFLSKGFPIDE